MADQTITPEAKIIKAKYDLMEKIASADRSVKYNIEQLIAEFFNNRKELGEEKFRQQSERLLTLIKSGDLDSWGGFHAAQIKMYKIQISIYNETLNLL